ncbi:hypothetical protein Trydic_g17805 [Trypoxylus dichotomus]
MNFQEKVVLVTGGAYGIGASCVEEFLRRDVKGLVVADADEGKGFFKRLDDTYGGRVSFIKTDVTDKNSIENAFEQTIAKYGNIDVIINSAAMFDESQWEKVIQINLISTAQSCLLAVDKYLPKYKIGQDAYIVNIISLAGLVPVEAAPHYSASKHGVVGLTRSYGCTKSIIRSGICVMGICQGLTDIPLLKNINSSTTLYGELDERMAILPRQKPEVVAAKLMEMLENPESGAIWIVYNGVCSKAGLPTLEK